MRIRQWSIEDGGWTARSILECRGAPPLWADRGEGGIYQRAKARTRSKARRLTAGLLSLLTSALCLRAQAQYSIDWSTIAGGGGSSSNGQYSVSGTIGQPDAGVMSGGNYTLAGGFWGLIAAVQTPGAPYLSIVQSNSAVVVSWPLPAQGWVLEWTNALPRVSFPWPQIAPPYQTNGTSLQFIDPLPAGNRFYRLHKP